MRTYKHYTVSHAERRLILETVAGDSNNPAGGTPEIGINPDQIKDEDFAEFLDNMAETGQFEEAMDLLVRGVQEDQGKAALITANLQEKYEGFLKKKEKENVKNAAEEALKELQARMPKVPLEFSDDSKETIRVGFSPSPEVVAGTEAGKPIISEEAVGRIEEVFTRLAELLTKFMEQIGPLIARFQKIVKIIQGQIEDMFAYDSEKEMTKDSLINKQIKDPETPKEILMKLRSSLVRRKKKIDGLSEDTIADKQAELDTLNDEKIKLEAEDPVGDAVAVHKKAVTENNLAIDKATRTIETMETQLANAGPEREKLNGWIAEIDARIGGEPVKEKLAGAEAKEAAIANFNALRAAFEQGKSYTEKDSSERIQLSEFLGYVRGIPKENRKAFLTSLGFKARPATNIIELIFMKDGAFIGGFEFAESDPTLRYIVENSEGNREAHDLVEQLDVVDEKAPVA